MTTMEQGRIMNPPRVTADMLPYLRIEVRHAGTGDLMDAPASVLTEMLEKLGFMRSLDPQLPKTPILKQTLDNEQRTAGDTLGQSASPIIIPPSLFWAYNPEANGTAYRDISYTINGLPAGLAYYKDVPFGGFFILNAITGSTNQVGTFTVVVRATDIRSGLWSETSFVLTIVSPNRAPQPPTLLTYAVVNGTERTFTLPPFTDPDGGPLEYGLSFIVPVELRPNFAFNNLTRAVTTVAAIPPGTYRFTYSATDSNGLAGAVQGNLIVTTPVREFRLVAPDYICETGQIKFNTEGGDGTAITFWAPGITGDTTNPDGHYIDAGVRSDQSQVTLFARQSGVQVSYVFPFKEVCAAGNTTPGEKPVSPGYTAITATIGQFLDYTFAPFTHPLNTISYAFGGQVPPGLLLDNPATRQLSGTPSRTGQYAIQITATAALGGGRTSQASATLIVQVVETASTLRMTAPTPGLNQLSITVTGVMANVPVSYRILGINGDTWQPSPIFAIPSDMAGSPLTLEARQGSTITRGRWTPASGSFGSGGVYTPARFELLDDSDDYQVVETGEIN